MDILRKQVGRAQRRLILQQFLTVLVWSLFATLLVAFFALAVPKVWPLPVDASIWTASWLGGALAAGVLSAVAWTIAFGHSRIDAAIELDRRFGLKERVSSSLALGQEDLRGEMGQALVQDAVRRISRIDVTERFGIKGRWATLLPLVPATAVFVLMLAVPNAVAPPGREAEASLVVKKQVKNSTQELERKLAERQARAEEAGLKEAGDLLKKLQAGVGQLGKQDEDDRKQAMAKLNDLAEELKKRRAELGGHEQIRGQMNSLKNIKQGPADKMARALKDGDFGKALAELKELQKRVESASMNERQAAELAEQLKEMAEKMRQLADAHHQAKSELERQIEQLVKKGDMAEAGKLERQLEQLLRQNAQMDRLRQMAEKMGQCAQCLQQGDSPGGAQQLGQLAIDLDQMQLELDELQMLDEAMEEFGQAKESMNCKGCNGFG
jgi:hypothetical protein